MCYMCVYMCYICVKLSHFAVEQWLAQYCKSTILKKFWPVSSK